MKGRILCILHMCLAFTYLCWLCLQPFVKIHLIQKAELSLYEEVFSRTTYFSSLPASDQILLLEGYKKAAEPRKHFFFRTVLAETPIFAWAWLFFSIVICLLLLFHIEGARHAVWILPVLVLALGAFLLFKKPPETETLFPSETYVITRYAKEKDQALGKREKLLAAWHRYLVVEWGKENPHEDTILFKEQVEKGLFAFNVERLKWILSGKGNELSIAGFINGPSFLRLFLYLVWNLFFAWEISKAKSVRISSIKA